MLREERNLLLQRAQEAHRRGLWREAEGCFRRLYEARQDDAEVCYGFGMLCLQTGRPAAAAELLSCTLKAMPGSRPVRDLLGAALIAAGNAAGACKVLERAISGPAPSPASLANYGLTLDRLGRSTEALPYFERALALREDDIDAAVNYGIALMHAGRLEEALARHRRTLEKTPGWAVIYINFGLCLMALDRNQEAETAFRQAQALEPAAPEPHCNLGTLYGRLGRHAEALTEYEAALACAPGTAQIHRNIATIQLELGHPEEAIRHCQHAIAIAPDDTAAQYGLGKALAETGRSAEAASAFAAALKAEPDYAPALLGLGQLELSRGRPQEAERYFRMAARDPRQTEALYALSRLCPVTAEDPLLATLEGLRAQEDSVPLPDRVGLHFALYQIYEKLGRYDDAFAEMRAGNAVKRRQVSYDEETECAALAHMTQTFDPWRLKARLSERPPAGHPSDVPIFILGMPRSGTTLIEQILATHPQVFGGGERMDFGRTVVGEGGYLPKPLPFAPLRLTAEQRTELGGRYVERLCAAAPQARRITDKLPANFRFVGLIRLVLPNARIIHVRRDPMDTCFSCLSLSFQGALNYTYDQGELGRYYRAYAALMAHWRRALPEGAMYEIDYEDLVGDFETQTRRLVAWCGLDWNDACLNFFGTERTVRTASNMQVRQPIHRQSIGRWRRYEKYLTPLKRALGPLAGAAPHA